MEVKIALAKDLNKELTAKMAQKSFPKYRATQCFERWARDLRNDFMQIPLCGRRLELGELKNPRVKPEPTNPLYSDHGIFKGDSYKTALLLYGYENK